MFNTPGSLRRAFLLFCLLGSLVGKVAQAAAQDPLIVYIRDSFYATCGPALEKIAKDELSAPVRFVRLGSALLMGRLRRERSSIQADIVIGADSCLTPELQDLGVIGAAEVPSSAFRVPVEWPYKNVLPFCYGFLGLLYKASSLKAPPETLEDILASNMSIVMPHPRSSTIGLIFAAWIKQHEPPMSSQKMLPLSSSQKPADCEQRWLRFQERLLSMPKGLSQAFALFLAGNVDMVVAYTTSAAYAAVRHHRAGVRSLPLKEAPFHAYTGFLTPKGAPKKAAQALLRGLLREDLQKALVEKDCLYPVSPHLQKEGLFLEKRPRPSVPRVEFTQEGRRDFLHSLTTVPKGA